MRRLTAIPAANPVGYCWLMGANKEAALAALKSRRPIIQKTFEERGGRIVGSISDSLYGRTVPNSKISTNPFRKR